MLNLAFFVPKNFNLFYISSPEKFSKSPIRAPIYPRKKIMSEVKKFISEVFFSTSEVEHLDFEQKIRREPVDWDSLLFAGTKIIHFRRNPNRFNISQQPPDGSFAAICSRRGLACVILRGAHEWLEHLGRIGRGWLRVHIYILWCGGQRVYYGVAGSEVRWMKAAILDWARL